MKKCHSFFALIGDDYITDHDFYRYCAEHEIGRANVQKGMNEGIHVITHGQHKGSCFAWSDVGTEAMRAARNASFSETKQNRKAGVTQSWDARPRETKRAIGITMKSPEGKIMEFRTLREMTSVLSKSYASVSAVEAPHLFTSGIWAGWTKLES